jgi:predicted nucleic acid-binding protein
VTGQAVVDSCVAVKWVVREEHSDKAVELLQADLHLVAPDLVLMEIANALWKNVKRGLVSAEQANVRLNDVPGFFNRLLTTPDLVAEAFALGNTADVPIYDCIYVVAARRIGARLVTADAKLVSKLAGTPDEARVIHISDWN